MLAVYLAEGNRPKAQFSNVPWPPGKGHLFHPEPRDFPASSLTALATAHRLIPMGAWGGGSPAVCVPESFCRERLLVLSGLQGTARPWPCGSVFSAWTQHWLLVTRGDQHLPHDASRLSGGQQNQGTERPSAGLAQSSSGVCMLSRPPGFPDAWVHLSDLALAATPHSHGSLTRKPRAAPQTYTHILTPEPANVTLLAKRVFAELQILDEIILE